MEAILTKGPMTVSVNAEVPPANACSPQRGFLDSPDPAVAPLFLYAGGPASYHVHALRVVRHVDINAMTVKKLTLAFAKLQHNICWQVKPITESCTCVG